MCIFVLLYLVTVLGVFIAMRPRVGRHLRYYDGFNTQTFVYEYVKNLRNIKSVLYWKRVPQTLKTECFKEY